jgi:predicted PurR-regulated permease PerM
MTDNQDEKVEHADPQSIRLEISLHQLAFWRFFAWLKVTMQKTVIWGVFFFLLYLLSDFFPLIFLTFVLTFVGTSIVRGVGRLLPRLGWKPRVMIVWILLIAIVTGVVLMLVPQVKNGVRHLRESIQDFPRKWTEDIEPGLIQQSSLYRGLLGMREEGELPPDVTATQPTSRPQLWEISTVRSFIDETKASAVKKMPVYLKDAVALVSAIFMLIFLSLLFSFLIALDLGALKGEVMKLDHTKLKGFYRETILNIVKFGEVLGKVFEAQAVIALVNTVLTAIGLHFFFDMPHIAFLCVGVFICGFIPVAGVFISSVPICLVGLFHDGVSTFFWLIGFITLIHMLEAYVLNPRIMGATLRVNPVLVLVVLVIGHHMGGVWGLLLGVPVCYYFFNSVIKRDTREIGLRVKLGRRARSANDPPSSDAGAPPVAMPPPA